jgi:hypothetical protein
MPRLILKNYSSHRYLPLHPQYLEMKKKIRKKLREFRISILSMGILSLVPIILLEAVSLL